MRRSWPWLAAIVAIGAGAWWWIGRSDAPAAVAAVVDAAPRATAPAPPEIAEVSEPEPEGGAAAEVPGGEGPPVAGLDLERLREKIPEHSYWRLMAPTDDKELLAMREARARELNVLYGKVLSGTGTEEEIHEYFEERRRISEDAISFASAVIVEMGDELGERERAMLDLAITLHRQRLAELPRRLADAEQRKREQDARREEWLRTGR